MKILKTLLGIGLLVFSYPAMAQTAGQSINGFLLAQGSTYSGFTCPSSSTTPCFVQYGSAIPVDGTVTAAPQTAAAPAVSASGSVTSLVLKASATTTGVQYFHAENGTAVSGYCILYNATSAPSTGALTAASVLAFQLLPANGYCDWHANAQPPIAASTGAVLLLSSASTPFTYTTGSITGSIYGLAQ